MFRKIKLTKKELEAKLTSAYVDGYKIGYRYGQESAVFSSNSPNFIRKVIGLPPIEKKE